MDAGGNLFIADYGNARVRKVYPDDTITTVAGGGNSRQEGVPAADTQLLSGLGVAVDSQGNLYLAEEYGGIQKVSPDGTITTIVGGGNNYIVDAVVILPIAVAVDFAGDLSIADNLFFTRVRRVSASGILTTIAGNGGNCCFGGDGGPAPSAQFSCRNHGGCSTGPRTPEGLERCRRANWKHGRYAQESSIRLRVL